MENFTPVPALLGGLMIGAAAALLLWTNGRIAGISGIAAGLLGRPGPEHGWRIAFVVGLIAAAPVYALATGEAIRISLTPSLPLLIGGGLLVGFGARLGSGCTSGHGICGLARLSVRSLAATGTFMAVAVGTVFIIRHLLGGAGG